MEKLLVQTAFFRLQQLAVMASLSDKPARKKRRVEIAELSSSASSNAMTDEDAPSSSAAAPFKAVAVKTGSKGVKAQAPVSRGVKVVDASQVCSGEDLSIDRFLLLQLLAKVDAESLGELALAFACG